MSRPGLCGTTRELRRGGGGGVCCFPGLCGPGSGFGAGLSQKALKNINCAGVSVAKAAPAPCASPEAWVMGTGASCRPPATASLDLGARGETFLGTTAPFLSFMKRRLPHTHTHPPEGTCALTIGSESCTANVHQMII